MSFNPFCFQTQKQPNPTFFSLQRLPEPKANRHSTFNSTLTAARRATLDGCYDPHSNLIFYPRATQPTHAKWEQIYPPLSNHEHNDNSDKINNDSNSHSKPDNLPPVPPLLLATHLITDTVFESPPFAGLGLPGADGGALDLGANGLPRLEGVSDDDDDDTNTSGYADVDARADAGAYTHTDTLTETRHDGDTLAMQIDSSTTTTTTNNNTENATAMDIDSHTTTNGTNNDKPSSAKDDNGHDNDNDDINNSEHGLTINLLPPDARKAYREALAAQKQWRQKWSTESRDGARGRLKMGFVGVPV